MSHNAAGMDVIVTEEEDGVVADCAIGLVGEIAVDALVVAVAVVVVGGGEGGLVEVLRRVGVVLAVVRERPELRLPPGPPHHLQHPPLIHVPRHRHLLPAHVHLHAIDTCKYHS